MGKHEEDVGLSVKSIPNKAELAHYTRTSRIRGEERLRSENGWIGAGCWVNGKVRQVRKGTSNKCRKVGNQNTICHQVTHFQ